MTIEKMKAEIKKVFEAPLNNDDFEDRTIRHAKFVCQEVLEHCANNDQVMDMYGFIIYCRSNPDKFKNGFPGSDIDNYIRFNITHDIDEFFDNHKESWFSPRTSGYRKYINLTEQNKKRDQVLSS